MTTTAVPGRVASDGHMLELLNVPVEGDPATLSADWQLYPIDTRYEPSRPQKLFDNVCKCLDCEDLRVLSPSKQSCTKGERGMGPVKGHSAIRILNEQKKPKLRGLQP